MVSHLTRIWGRQQDCGGVSSYVWMYVCVLAHTCISVMDGMHLANYVCVIAYDCVYAYIHIGGRVYICD